MQPPSSGKSLSLDQFAKHLVDSGLMSAEQVKARTSRILAVHRADCRPFVQELVKQQNLTLYQATMLSQGKSKGLVLGNYVILDKLGQGGMGTVFKARHRRLQRVFALKVLSPEFTQKPEAVRRFQREVQMAAKLTHPNIVSTQDADEAQGVHFLVMEYVEGSDLSNLVKKQGPMPVGKAVQCILDAARGLEHAHAMGIIHRDIKPANLLLDSKGIVKILDMGLARVEGSGNNPAASADELTQSGSILGTCDYMAPEQALNTKRADRRADIYSLGCALYFLLSGKAIYGGETTMEKLMAHQQESVPLLPNVSKPLQAVFRRMVAKKPEVRYQSMTEVISALQVCAPTKDLAANPDMLARSAGGSPLTARVADDTNAIENGRTEFTSGRNASTKSTKRLITVGVVVGLIATCAIFVAALASSKESGEKRMAQKQPTALQPGGKWTPGTERQMTRPQPSETGKVRRPDDRDWVDSVVLLPAEKQVDAVVARLKQRNPGFNGKVTPEIYEGKVVKLVLNSDELTDISPLRALEKMYWLDCSGSGRGKGKLADLAPLKGLRLSIVALSWNPVRDLSPLRGMPLNDLYLWGTLVTDLSPLKGTPIRNTLQMPDTPIRDLSPLEGMPLKSINYTGTRVSDIRPLKAMPLTHVWCDFHPERDSAVLRSIKTLERINDQPAAAYLKQFPAR